MLDNSLKHVVDVEKLNVSLLSNSSEYFQDKDYAVILHDPSDIRKPHSQKLEDLGKVKSLEGKLVNGYRTFNSIAVDLKGASLRLLSSSPYSTGKEAFVGVGETQKFALKASEEKYWFLAEDTQEIISLQNSNLQYTYVSPRTGEVANLDPKSMIERTSFNYLHQ